MPCSFASNEDVETDTLTVIPGWPLNLHLKMLDVIADWSASESPQGHYTWLGPKRQKHFADDFVFVGFTDPDTAFDFRLRFSQGP